MLARDWLEELPLLADWSLKGDFISVVSMSFILSWKDASGTRLVDFVGLGLFSSTLTLAIISSTFRLVGPTASRSTFSYPYLS